MSENGGNEGREPLAFYEHARQGYGHMPINAAAQFNVGGYPGDDGGVDERGEFRIELHRLGRERRFGEPPVALTPKLTLFSDAYGALTEAIDAGLLRLLEKSRIESPDDLTAVLLGCGFRDRSEFPVGSPPPSLPLLRKAARFFPLVAAVGKRARMSTLPERDHQERIEREHDRIEGEWERRADLDVRHAPAGECGPVVRPLCVEDEGWGGPVWLGGEAS